MKILAISDVPSKALWDYCTRERLAGVDLILSCGDLPKKYLEYITNFTAAPILYVHGNHDGSYRTEGEPGGCICVDDQVYVWKGLRIMGLGGSIRYNREETFQYTEKEMRRRMRRLWFKAHRAGGIDLLLTHSPAAGLNDGNDRAHKGFACFNDLLEEYQPKWFVHGHVHLSYNANLPRVCTHGQTTVINEKLRALETLQKKLYAYNCASNSLYLDAVTVAPKNTAEGRGVALSILAGELQKLMTAPETLALVEELYARRETLDTLHRREVEELRRSCRQLTRIPAEEYMAYSELTNRASDVWHKAKEENDFASFCPILQELVEYNRKFAGYYDAEKAPYDALLNEYERGVDTQQLDVFFDTLRKGLVPLIRAIGEKPQIDDSFLHLEYPVEQQKAFADYLMEVMGLDRGHCGLGETEHPFTLEFNNKDVRITTNYDLHNVASSMYSVLHEGGHALYELGIRDDLQYTCLTGGVSMGVHESQSRFYENLIGRSRAFIGAIYPKVQEFFPAQLGNVTAEQFYRAVNKVEPSLIRTESDELTYCLHVMVRYEIEKQLIAGTLTAKKVPAAWAELYKEYLGVEVPNDREGCLQDSHWSGGSFGYFPSYALGNAYGAQMLHNMEQEFDVYGGVAHGDLSAVTGWLREKVHQYGHLLEPAEVVRNACGTFDAHYYLDYLTKKYTELYNL